MGNSKYRSYQQLIKDLDSARKPTYDELLYTYEWVGFRKNIVYRDKETCLDCGVSTIIEKSEEEYKADIAKSTSEAKVFKIIDGEPAHVSVNHSEVTEREKQKAIRLATSSVSRIKVANPAPKLEVHHLWYIFNTLPWEYPEDCLITLCDKCHQSRHFDENGNPRKSIDVYSDKSKREKLIGPACNRCGGGGYILEYAHVQGGVCFECWGTGIGAL